MSTWIFLRGLTRESRHWGDLPRQFCTLIPDAEVVTLDLPGNGRLHRMRSPIAVGTMADFCRAELALRGLTPPYQVLAMSLGAMVAIDWAARFPQELLGSVLINTSLRPFSPFYQRLRPENYLALLRLGLPGASDRTWEETILRLTSRQAARSPEVLREWIAYRHDAPVSGLNAARQLIAAVRFKAPEQCPRVPMLVLASACDGLVHPMCSRRLAHQWNLKIAEHPCAGHDIPLDDPAWVIAQVRDLLARR